MRRAAEAWRISGDGLIPVLAVTAACFLLGGLVGCLLASHIGGGGQESLAAYVEGFLRAAQAGEITAPALASLVWDTVRWPLLALLLGFTALGPGCWPDGSGGMGKPLRPMGNSIFSAAAPVPSRCV